MTADQSPSGTTPLRADIPWLTIEAVGNPTIRLDARALDRLEVSGSDLILAVEDVELDLEDVAGADHARDIVGKLAPYTRRAQITRQDVYEDARARLRALTEATSVEPGVLGHALFIGPRAVFSRGERLHIGDLLAFDLSEVREYAMAGEVLPLPHGARLQAALAVLVVPLEQRTLEKDLDLLAKRIAAYEARVR